MEDIDFVFLIHKSMRSEVLETDCHLCAIGVHNQSVGTTVVAELWRIKYPFPSVT